VPINSFFKMPSIEIPEAPPASIKEISEASARASTRGDSGIFSPFEEGGDDADTKSMPRLVQRSLSFERMVSRGPEQLGSARKKVQGPGMALAQSRQRSATNLEPQRGAPRKKSLFLIAEDDG
jgi:hypothetical protein